MKLETAQPLTSVTFVTPNIARVRSTRETSFSNNESIICIPRGTGHLAPDLQNSEDSLSTSCGKLRCSMSKASGSLSFFDEHGNSLFSEPPDNPRVFEEVIIKEVCYDPETAKMVETVDGGRVEADITETGKTSKAWSIIQNFVWQEGEALYGLGSHEENVLNLRGTKQYLYQQNMKAVVPMLVSSRGYGLLFDANCELEFHDDELGSYVKLDAVQELDYYVIYGPDFDSIVAGYRELTGQAPMLPRWAFGYCQSKERYTSQEELIAIVQEYRKRNVPLDLIIQDWHYWPEGWIKEFVQDRYPDPAAMCDRIHELNARLMVSIWPRYGGEHSQAKNMRAKGYMLQDEITYDAYSKAARTQYWSDLENGLFKHGVDAWWCDCTEPLEADWNGAEKRSAKDRRDINTKAMRNLLGREQVNSYSLLHSKGIYDNQRTCSEEKRVINLTRSAYAGQQRYATITWSGDISARWDVFAQQIPCGLNFTVTGCPYWTNDIGAFFVGKRKGNAWFINGQFENGCNNLGYRELYTRWFQYGAFLPMFRSHGTCTPREIWRFGEPGEMVYDTLLKYIHLRYRLLPYIYSLAGMTTLRHYTIMRALAFDFRDDPNVLDIKDQYMFGPAFMVCPVTTPMYYGPDSTELKDTVKARNVHLPAGNDWYDFWTGKLLKGGQTITADAPLETMPLYVKAGSIVPMGPTVQYSDERLDADWTIQVYPGNDASFTVYEDDGDGYGYEVGEFSTWNLDWNNATATLTIGERLGEFPGMNCARQLHIKTVNGTSKTVTYEGEKMEIRF